LFSEEKQMMNTLIKSGLLSLLILSPAGNAVSQEIAVIVNPAFDASALDQNEIKLIYTGKSTLLTPYDQPESSVRQNFYQITTGRSFRQINAQWAKLVFSGRARAPDVLLNSKAVRRTIASDPNGIGYIEKSAVDETVKVIMVLTPEE
jgi:ABC-type phosphate transport system substrate-binding protein